MTQEQLYSGIRELADGVATLLNACCTLTDGAAYLATAEGDRAARRLRATGNRLNAQINELLRTAELLTEGAGIAPYEAGRLREAMERNGLIYPSELAEPTQPENVPNFR